MIETPILSGCGATYICKCCGHKRQVLSPRQWGWWYGADWCCSYHCMRELRRRDLAAHPKRLQKLAREFEGVPERRQASGFSDEECAAMWAMYQRGAKKVAVARAYNRDYKAVCRLLKRMEEGEHVIAAMVPDSP